MAFSTGGVTTYGRFFSLSYAPLIVGMAFSTGGVTTSLRAGKGKLVLWEWPSVLEGLRPQAVHRYDFPQLLSGNGLQYWRGYDLKGRGQHL